MQGITDDVIMQNTNNRIGKNIFFIFCAFKIDINEPILHQLYSLKRDNFDVRYPRMSF